MKGTIRIISGSLKGRVIPFNINRFDNADITPQKVKGALFSMLGEYLDGKTFIDLFSGSGQIGFEALSRNCKLAVFNEKDRQRYELIRNFLKLTGNDKRAILLNLNANSALKYLSVKGVKADTVYLDPPYKKEKGPSEFYTPLLDDIIQSGILTETSAVIVQHYSANDLPETCSILRKTDVKKYGTTSLSVYCISIQ